MNRDDQYEKYMLQTSCDAQEFCETSSSGSNEGNFIQKPKSGALAKLRFIIRPLFKTRS